MYCYLELKSCSLFSAIVLQGTLSDLFLPIPDALWHVALCNLDGKTKIHVIYTKSTSTRGVL